MVTFISPCGGEFNPRGEPMPDTPLSNPALITRHRGGFPHGRTWVMTEGEAALDAGFDFAIKKTRGCEGLEGRSGKGLAWVLLSGRAEGSVGGARAAVSRA